LNDVNKGLDTSTPSMSLL